MSIRNPVFTRNGSIDCEIEHPVYGWIPFTADPNDVEEHGRVIYAAAIKMSPAKYIPAPSHEPSVMEQEAARQAAFAAEADPLFFQWQAGEATEEEWKAKRQEIRDRYPYPDEKV